MVSLKSEHQVSVSFMQTENSKTIASFTALMDQLASLAAPALAGQSVVLGSDLHDSDAGADWDDDWLDDWEGTTNKSSVQGIEPFRARRQGPIVAVDAGAIILGETETHLLIALRATAVIIAASNNPANENVEEAMVLTARTGILPLPLAADGRTQVLYEIGKAMGQPDFFVHVDNSDPKAPCPTSLKEGTASRASHYADRIRAYLERLMQQAAVTQIQNGTVLLDGALTLRSRDTPDIFLRDLAKRAAAQRNALVGVSKRSELLVQGKPVRFWLDDTPYMACRRTLTPAMRKDENSDQRAERVLGGVYAARFSSMGATFRVDVMPPRGITEGEALDKMFTSALMRCGYPDLLVQAHALSSFTRSDVISLQAQACARYHLRPIPDFAANLSGIFAPFAGRFK